MYQENLTREIEKTIPVSGDLTALNISTLIFFSSLQCSFARVLYLYLLLCKSWSSFFLLFIRTYCNSRFDHLLCVLIWPSTVAIYNLHRFKSIFHRINCAIVHSNTLQVVPRKSILLHQRISRFLLKAVSSLLHCRYSLHICFVGRHLDHQSNELNIHTHFKICWPLYVISASDDLIQYFLIYTFHIDIYGFRRFLSVCIIDIFLRTVYSLYANE